MTRLDKIAIFVIALLALLLGGVLIFRPKPVPVPIPQSTIELAAQHAATAIVAVTKATDARQHHAATIRKVDSLLQRIDSTHDVTDALAGPPTPRQAAKDTVIAALLADNARLDSALAVTTPVLVKDTIVHLPQDTIPAAPLRVVLPSLGSKLVHSVLAHTAIGYGIATDGKTVATHYGPAVSVGLNLTSGTIGVTAGGTAVYSGGAVHVGVGATVGVRL